MNKRRGAETRRETQSSQAATGLREALQFIHKNLRSLGAHWSICSAEKECLLSAFLRGPLRLCVKSGLPNSRLRCRLGRRVFRHVPPVTVREPCHFTYYRIGMPQLDQIGRAACWGNG